MNYTDEEGNKLYGFSVDDMNQYNILLKQNTLWVKRIVIAIGSIGLLVLIYIFWLTYYVIKNNVVNNIVARCV